MSKEDTASGLLSKMVKFVRNPATNWADLDAAPTDRDEAMSKQLLKEMIERKRQNDFVRKREFDMLRKMRKREAMVGVGQDPGGRPSFFQSSMPSKPDDRATTLKKIDEIEAQMSMQWWKTKNGGDVDSSTPPSMPHGRSTASVHAPLLDNALPAAYRPTAPAGLQSAAAKAAQPPSAPMTQSDPLPTEPDSLSIALAEARGGGFAAKPPAPPVSSPPSVPSAQDSSASGFSASKFNAVDVEEVAHDAELEEAAIRFANGDDAGAEAGLLEILAPGAARTDHAETWLTLFDLYRATAQQDKFETAAIQFVERFDRSAPQWFSMPDMVKLLSTPEGKVAAGNGPAADWICPSVLGIQTVAALKAAIAKAPMPWRLDWKNLKSIEPAALEPLSKVFSGWAAQPVQLRFLGDPQLQKVLETATPSGNRDTDQNWWKLRMEALRVTHRPDDFELAALDFCVTYEVSPPAWDSARCEYKPLDAQGGAVSGQTIIGDVYRDSTPSSLSAIEGDTQMDAMSSQMSNMLSVELSGQIQGDAIAVLDKLEVKLMGADMMLISCSKLIRVDFSAAGTLLNWVSAREAENRAVQFSDVNRLVAAFFNVIGITEHARVLVRVD
ncbi:STAS domain-containing protein [Polaromonas sp. YR568]|uniref:STAS domain-containing protein n=1 Tax=Polaromonas sp. YR568 TaxID=1855301 RepID=UPI0008F26824|nr:STAS domain-containing protein [Polaromonas sp. YR568]SFU98342.1 STAS domain-containing protein [Polaromonas sp. YR568]